MKVAHIYSPIYEPASLDCRNSVLQSMSLLAVMQAITTHTNSIVYNTADSPIVKETAALAKSMGIPDEDVIVSVDNVRIKNKDGEWGSLTLRHSGKYS